MGEAWDIDIHTFPKVRLNIFHQIPNIYIVYGILYHLRNARIFPSTSHTTTKCSKTHLWERPGIYIAIPFPRSSYFSSIMFLSNGIQHHLGNVWVFPSISNSLKKWSNIIYGRDLGCRYPYLSRLFLFHEISNLWHFTSYGKWGNSMQKCCKSHPWEKPRA